MFFFYFLFRFLEPFVLLERISTRTSFKKSNQNKNKRFSRENVKILMKKGNEGLNCKDQHTCCLCQKNFSSSFNLKHHLSTVNCTAPKAYSESIEAFARKGNEGLLDKAPHTCFACRVIFSSRHSLKRHLTSSYCRKMESYSESVISLAKKGNEGLDSRDPHTCCICQKVVAGSYFLRQHLEKVHLKTRKMYCDLCPKVYFDKHDIASHMKQTHSKKTFACNICDYRTAVKHYLYRHKETHSEKVECPVCKKFVSFLRRHIERAHESRVNCSVCQKEVTKEWLSKHMATKHKKTIYQCDNCDESFGNKEDLRR